MLIKYTYLIFYWIVHGASRMKVVNWCVSDENQRTTESNRTEWPSAHGMKSGPRITPTCVKTSPHTAYNVGRIPRRWLFGLYRARDVLWSGENCRPLSVCLRMCCVTQQRRGRGGGMFDTIWKRFFIAIDVAVSKNLILKGFPLIRTYNIRYVSVYYSDYFLCRTTFLFV